MADVDMDGLGNTVRAQEIRMEEMRVGMEAMSVKVLALEGIGAAIMSVGGVDGIVARINQVESAGTPQGGWHGLLGRIGGAENAAGALRQELEASQGRIIAVEQTANGVVGGIANKMSQMDTTLQNMMGIEADTRAKAGILYEEAKG